MRGLVSLTARVAGGSKRTYVIPGG